MKVHDADQLTTPKHLTPEQRIELWAQWMDVADAMVMAGLRHRVGPEGDVQAAYREWYAREMEEHDAAMQQVMENLARCEARHGR
jgi:hypothetical protein